MQLGEPINVLDHGYVQHILHMGDDNTPLEAARMSTGNSTGVDEKKDDGLRHYLMKHEHMTPFEMCVLQIEVQCPIFVAREWMRHRTMSFNEFSGRYAVMPHMGYVPEVSRIRLQSDTNKQGSGTEMSETSGKLSQFDIRKHYNDSMYTYTGLIEDNVARELARLVVPVNQYTRFRVQANMRNWFQFLSLRLPENAQYEIRVYAEAVEKIVHAVWPKTTALWQQLHRDGMRLSSNERTVLAQLARQHEQEFRFLCRASDMREKDIDRLFESLQNQRH